MHTAIGDNEVHVLEETTSYTNGDYGVHMPEDGMNEDGTSVLSGEAASATSDHMDCKKDDATQTDALSKTTGGCSVVSVGEKSVQVSSWSQSVYLQVFQATWLQPCRQRPRYLNHPS